MSGVLVTAGKRRGIQIFAVVCITTIALALSSSPAWPEPGQGGMLADAPTLGLADVGSEGTLAFYGAEGTVLLTVPVPEGLVPAELTAVVEIPVNMATGTLTVAQDDRTLSRTVLPNTDQVPITIPLSGVSGLFREWSAGKGWGYPRFGVVSVS